MNQPKRVLITGCSSGFGFLLACKYMRSGYTTYASVRNLDSPGAKELRSIAKAEKLPLHLLHIDVTDEMTIQNAMKQISGPIDILINNAGFGYLGPIENFTVDEIKEQYETNIFGVLRMVKAVVPRMREKKKGMIINVSSINGLIPFPLYGVYSSSKFAVETLSEGLHFELSPFGIRVVLVEPGSFFTDFPNNIRHPKAMLSKESVYRPLTDHFFSRFNKVVRMRGQNGFIARLFNPERVVNKIYSISQMNNPSLRYRIGVDAQLYYWAKRFLPAKVWEKILRNVYKW